MLHQRARQVTTPAPRRLSPAFRRGDVAWVLDETAVTSIGNEFLLWLWFHAEMHQDTFKLSDDSK